MLSRGKYTQNWFHITFIRRPFRMMLLIVFLSIMTVSSTGATCKGDGDCQQNQLCLSGECYWLRSYGELCSTTLQCRGFNVQCFTGVNRSSKGICACPSDSEYDRGNCRSTDACFSDGNCGLGYKCVREGLVDGRCELLKPPGLDAGSITAIVLGVGV